MDLGARNGSVHHIAEWSLVSEVERDDPFNQVTVDLLVTGPTGQEQVSPAFWAGGREWRVRYAPTQAGRYLVSSRCSDAADGGLHGCAGELHVAEAAGVTNPLLRHGPIRVAAGSRHLEHSDGTPFLWLEPPLPVIDSEGNYEGIRGTNRDDVQRFQFWSTMLSGAAGYSYGANGIWQVDRSDRPYGASPHGTSWGGRPWDEVAALPGAAQVGVGKGVLQRFPWWRCEPHPEWVEPHQHAGNRHLAYAAGIPGELRILYLPCELSDPVTVCGLETGLTYEAELVYPETGEVTPLDAVTGDAAGRWQVPPVPVFRDWLLVLEHRP